MTQWFRTSAICLFVITSLVAGCTNAPQSGALQDTPAFLISATRSAMYTMTPIIPTQTISLAVMNTPTLASLPTQLSIGTPQAMPTQKPPTWTPLPTLTEQQSMEMVNDLLANNAGCQLPCWWGITPGETQWTDAVHFFNSFARVNLEFESSRLENGVWYPYARYKVQYNITSPLSGGLIIGTENGIVSWIDVDISTSHFGFQLHQILAKYGKPDLVSIWTMEDAPFRPLPFVLVLYYQDLNTLAVYYFDAALKNDVLISCPSSNSDSRLYLQPVEEILESDEIRSMALGAPPPYGEPPQLRPVDEVTKMDIEAFWMRFQDANACIETPANLWQP